MPNLANKLFDADEILFCHLLRDRRQLIDAIIDIENALNDPAHGAYHSDLHGSIFSIINTLKAQIGGNE